MIIGHALSRQSMNRSRTLAAGWRLCPHSIPRGMQTSAPITTSSTSGDSRQTTQQTLRCHLSTQIRTCMALSHRLGRWRSLGLPSSGKCLLSSSAPPSRSTLVCRYRPCSRPYPCRGAGHLVMQPTSRSLPSGTPAPPLEPPASSLLIPANPQLSPFPC